MNRSSISDLLGKTIRDSDNVTDEQIKKFTIDELRENFLDGSYSIGSRKNIFDELLNRDEDLAREQITNLCRIYDFSGSRDTKSFIYFLLDYGKLDIFMKIECTHTLYQVDPKDALNYYFKILKNFRTDKNRPSITLYIDILRYVLTIDINKEIKDNIEWTLLESGLNWDYIYKCIISIQKDQDRPIHINTLQYFYQKFFEHCKDPQYKILSAQYLLQNKLMIQDVQKTLLEICQNQNIEYNIRADSADTLVKLADESTVIIAKEIIRNLGRDGTNLDDYSNRQNVHDEKIDESVRNFLLELGSLKLDLDLESVYQEFGKYIKEKYEELQDKINSSLLRIKIDQIIYPGSQTLSTIFIKIYSMILKHQLKDLLLQRLTEELIDMEATCSSGHCSRLVNVFSGVDGFNMNIGYSKQIQGNIMGRLTKLIKELENKEEQELILNEMIEEKILLDKPNFSKFFKVNIMNIYEELEKEYVYAGITKDDFELYFRGGIAFFETGINV